MEYEEKLLEEAQISRGGRRVSHVHTKVLMGVVVVERVLAEGRRMCW